MKNLIFLIILIVVLGVSLFWFLNQKKEKIDELFPTASSSASPAPDQPDQKDISFLLNQEKVIVVLETDKGPIKLELYPAAAPKTVFNFVSLAQKGFYDGTKFHRVVPGFVVQGGDPLSKTDDPGVGTGGPGYVFEDEINPRSLGLSEKQIAELEAAGYVYNYQLSSLPNTAGALAMANAGPHTNGSQFFIITEEDQPFLNGKHTVFGKVVKGMDIVLKIKQGDIINKISFSLQ